MTLPNFLVIGAAKSGTTALYYYLRQHPDIFMSPVKETNFFVLEGKRSSFNGPGDNLWQGRYSITDFQEYQKLFEEVTHEKAIGEVSPLYLFHESTPERIKMHLGSNVKLIAILRNPVDRAFSNYLMMVRDGREPLSGFMQAIAEEETRIAENWEWGWYYLRTGFYYEQIRRYLDFFEREQLRIFLYEEFVSVSNQVMSDIFEFLGVDDTFLPNMSSKYNVSGTPKNRWINAILTKPNPLKRLAQVLFPNSIRVKVYNAVMQRNLVRPLLSKEDRCELIEIYLADILRSLMYSKAYLEGRTNGQKG